MILVYQINEQFAQYYLYGSLKKTNTLMSSLKG